MLIGVTYSIILKYGRAKGKNVAPVPQLWTYRCHYHYLCLAEKRR